MLQTDVAVVGAGPAGLAAAAAASSAGARVVLVDRYARPGGQYFIQPPSGCRASGRPDWGQNEDRGRQLLAAIENGNVTLLADTTVFASDQDQTLHLASPDRSLSLQPRKVVLATGAYERVIPFPGWTLPGVFTAGAMQSLVKTQRVLPARRVVVAGSGPLLYAVASTLVDAGAQVVALVEAGRWSDIFSHLPTLARNWSLSMTGARYLVHLRRAGVPMLMRHAVLRAGGDGQLERVTVGPLDHKWSPTAGAQRRFEADALCLNYGFLPSTDLPRMLGCEMQYRPALGGYVPVCNQAMETSVSGVFVAGEAAGIGGAAVAMVQGEIAGLAAARQLGLVPERKAEARLAKLRNQLARLSSFRDAMSQVFGLRPGILDLTADDTIVCRCEEVTKAEIRRAALESRPSLREVKYRAWSGMGPCQGRFCAEVVQRIVAEVHGVAVEQVELPRVRPPVGTVSVAALLTEEEEVLTGGKQ
mgnify:CR=1 FL=1